MTPDPNAAATLQRASDIERLAERLRLGIGDQVEIADARLFFDCATGHTAPDAPMPVTPSNRHGAPLGQILDIGAKPNLTMVFLEISRLSRDLYSFYFRFRSLGIRHEYSEERLWTGNALFTHAQYAERELKEIYATPQYGVFHTVHFGHRYLRRENGKFMRGTPMPDGKTLLGDKKLHLGGHLKEPMWEIARLSDRRYIFRISAVDKHVHPKRGELPARQQHWFEVEGHELQRTVNLNDLHVRAWDLAFAEMPIGQRRLIPIKTEGHYVTDEGKLHPVMRYQDSDRKAVPLTPLDKLDLTDDAYCCTTYLTKITAHRMRVDQRWETRSGEYAGRTAIMREGDRWITIEKDHKHAFEIAKNKGKLLSHLMAAVYEKIYGRNAIQVQRRFQVSPLTMEVRGVSCYIPKTLIAQSKWGPSAQDIANSGLRLVRLTRMLDIKEPIPEIVVFRTGEQERVEHALRAAGIGPKDIHLTSFTDLMARAKLPADVQLRYLTWLREADDMADSRDLDGLTELRKMVRKAEPMHKKKISPAEADVPAEIVVAEEETWQERLMRFVTERPALALNELRLVLSQKNCPWETEYQTSVAAVASYLLEQISTGRLKGEGAEEMEALLKQLVPLLSEEDYRTSVWREIVAYRKLSKLFREARRREEPDFMSITTAPEHADGAQIPSVSVGTFSMTRRIEDIRTQLIRLGRRCKRTSLPIKDVWTGASCEVTLVKETDEGRQGRSSRGRTRSDPHTVHEIDLVRGTASLPAQESLCTKTLRALKLRSHSPLKNMLRAIGALEKLPNPKDIEKDPVSDRAACLAAFVGPIDVFCMAHRPIWERFAFFHERKGSNLPLTPGELVKGLDGLANHKLLPLDSPIEIGKLAGEIRHLAQLLFIPIPHKSATGTSARGRALRQRNSQSRWST